MHTNKKKTRRDEGGKTFTTPWLDHVAQNLHSEVVLHHGHHGVLNVLLLGRKAGGGILLFELGRQLLDDKVRVTNLFTVELDEGQHAPLGTQLGVVVDILKTTKIFILS